MFIPEIETSSTQKITLHQEELLKKQLAYLNLHSPYYSELFKKHKIDLQKINKLSDLALIPTTSKDTIQDRNKDFFCVDKGKIIDYVTTSGTLGSPITFILTEKDIERLAYNEFLSLGCTGITEEDIIQLTTTIDRCFMAGIAYFLGSRKLGAGVVRVGPGIPELQWDMIKRISPTVLVVVPSFLLKLIEFAEAHKIDFRNSSIKKAVCVGEAIRNEDFSLNTLGKKITDKWGLKLYSTYASTEMSTAFTECDHSIGGHHHPELVIIELLDDNNQLVNKGEAGELTITTLGIEGMPLLRYKTGDICKSYSEPCKCGRNTERVGPILGRKKQMIKYKGTTLYPNALQDVLQSIDGIKRYVTEAFTNEIGTDDLRVNINYGGHDADIEKKIKDRFRTALRVVPTINFCDEKYLDSLLPNSYSRKPIDFIDKRLN
jgi:phenylacetate-CoA ligase